MMFENIGRLLACNLQHLQHRESSRASLLHPFRFTIIQCFVGDTSLYLYISGGCCTQPKEGKCVCPSDAHLDL